MFGHFATYGPPSQYSKTFVSLTSNLQVSLQIIILLKDVLIEYVIIISLFKLQRPNHQENGSALLLPDVFLRK